MPLMQTIDVKMKIVHKMIERMSKPARKLFHKCLNESLISLTVFLKAVNTKVFTLYVESFWKII